MIDYQIKSWFLLFSSYTKMRILLRFLAILSEKYRFVCTGKLLNKNGSFQIMIEQKAQF